MENAEIGPGSALMPVSLQKGDISRKEGRMKRVNLITPSKQCLKALLQPVALA
jgi:hypothetical protein